jgi:hypothetical protein
MTTITRPHEGRQHVTYPYRLGNPAVFSQLVVGSDEHVVFRRHGAILGTVGPGTHSLSPTGTPFLEPAKTTDARSYACDVIFVTTGTSRLELDGVVGELTDTSGKSAEFSALAYATVRARDPRQVVSEGIGVGEAGDAFDRIVKLRLTNGIKRELAGVFERGAASPEDLRTIGPALMSAGRADSLGIAVLGLELTGLEVVRLASVEGFPPAGLDAGDRRAEHAYADALPKGETCHFGGHQIPFRDTRYGRMVRVSAVGHFEGDPVPAHLDQWVKDLILAAMREAAATWNGTVLDLPDKKDEWARWITSVVAPQIHARTQLRGRAVLTGVQIDREDEAELKRLRAAEQFGR